MAGSYKNIATDDGMPREQFGIGSTLIEEGDIIETLRVCYGMIWWLSTQLTASYSNRRTPTRDTVMACIGLAETNALTGQIRGTSKE